MHLEDSFRQYIADRKKRDQFRSLSLGRSVLSFSNNDYLNLSQHPEVKLAACTAIDRWGAGSTGSRLLSGNHSSIEGLEAEIAGTLKFPSSLIFNSGYTANSHVLASLLSKSLHQEKPLVFFDKLNHASLYHAVLSNDVELIRYHHNNMDDLAKKLNCHKNTSRFKIIVTESLFGMTGTVASLESIRDMAIEHRCMVYVDEAHAIGIMGVHGAGLASTLSWSEVPLVIMGTFSKALGGFGAFIGCSSMTKEYLIQVCPGFIYTTALPPAVISSALKSWELMKNMDKERLELQEKGAYVRAELIKRGYHIGACETSIIPIYFETESDTLKMKNKLLAKGIEVSAIRPPTVPPRSSRLRIALRVDHRESHIQQLLNGFSV